MKSKKKQSTGRTGMNRAFLLTVMLLLLPGYSLLAQAGSSGGAQSAVFGQPFAEAYFSIPVIFGSNMVCNGQTTTLSVDSGYSSYAWSNGQTTRTTTVGAGTYTVTVSDVLGCTRSNTITVLNDTCGLVLNLGCYIEGYYIGSGIMAAVLMNQGIGSDPLVTDTVETELREAAYPYGITASGKTLLHTDGTAQVSFQAAPGSYYIAVRHRNGLYTWSANPLVFGSTPVNYSFALNPGSAYGNNAKQVEPGIWALYSGDLNRDENIDLLDASILEADINNFESGYRASDLNGDGNVDLLDSPVQEMNINDFIYAVHP